MNALDLIRSAVSKILLLTIALLVPIAKNNILLNEIYKYIIRGIQ